MPRLTISVLLLCLAQWSWAQTVEDVANVARAELRTEKSALMTQAMMLTDTQSEKFWPLYREYENELDKITDARLNALKVYSDSYDSMTDKKADELVGDMFDMEKARLELRKKYYKKMKKALDGVTAARFAQVDRQISTLVDLEIMQMVPLIATPEELGGVPVPAE
jgi:Spy/CpxP family protein refolding chaperone